MKKFLAVLMSVIFAAVSFSACSNETKKDETKKGSGEIDINITIDSHYADIDTSVVRAYEKLCEAVLAGEESVTFNIQMLDDISQLFYTSFPLNSLVSSINILPDRTGVSLVYKNGNEEHKRLVSDFNSRVDEILSACDINNAGKDRFVFNVYTYITNNFQIDTSVVSVYDVIMNARGAAATINSAFEYLLLCGEVKASHIINTAGAGSMLSLAEFASDYYYFDPGSEITDNSGACLKYFAMNDERVNNYITGGMSYTDSEEVGAVTDDSYSKLASSVSYTADEKGVSVIYGNNESFLLEIN